MINTFKVDFALCASFGDIGYYIGFFEYLESKKKNKVIHVNKIFSSGLSSYLTPFICTKHIKNAKKVYFDQIDDTASNLMENWTFTDLFGDSFAFLDTITSVFKDIKWLYKPVEYTLQLLGFFLKYALFKGYAFWERELQELDSTLNKKESKELKRMHLIATDLDNKENDRVYIFKGNESRKNDRCKWYWTDVIKASASQAILTGCVTIDNVRFTGGGYGGTIPNTAFTKTTNPNHKQVLLFIEQKKKSIPFDNVFEHLIRLSGYAGYMWSDRNAVFFAAFAQMQLIKYHVIVHNSSFEKIFTWSTSEKKYSYIQGRKDARALISKFIKTKDPIKYLLEPNNPDPKLFWLSDHL